MLQTAWLIVGKFQEKSKEIILTHENDFLLPITKINMPIKQVLSINIISIKKGKWHNNQWTERSSGPTWRRYLCLAVQEAACARWRRRWRQINGATASSGSIAQMMKRWRKDQSSSSSEEPGLNLVRPRKNNISSGLLSSTGSRAGGGDRTAA